MVGNVDLARDVNLVLPMLLPWAFTMALALSRVVGVLLALPNTMSPRVPRMVKAVMVISIAVALVVAQGPTIEVLGQPNAELALLSMAVGDFVLGLTLGFFVHIGLATVRFAGELCGVEMGLSFAAVADPMSQDQTTPVAIIFGQIAIQIFFALGIDRDVLRALGESVNVQPLGHAGMHLFRPEEIAMLGDSLFRVGFQIAMPIVGALFALKLSIALLARVAPKIQLFVLSFTLTLLLGHTLLVAAMPTIGAAVASHLSDVADQVTRFALLTRDG